MKTSSPRPPPRHLAAFTLVEIMIVVVIIGLLAAMAIPAFQRVQEASQNSRFISDLRTFAQGFETYATKNGGWPPNAGTAVVPTGMSGEINDAAWTTAKNSVGGKWNWDRNNLGIAAAISCVNATASDAQMTAIDAKIDDGDLRPAVFRKSAVGSCTFSNSSAGPTSPGSRESPSACGGDSPPGRK